MIATRTSRERWNLWVTNEEFHDIHHALRMLLKHPFAPRGDEAVRLSNAANTLWNAHCEQGALTRERGAE